MDKAYGGSGYERLYSLIENNGYYILGGHSFSGISGNKSTPSRGDLALWMMLVDSSLNKIGELTIGGDSLDFFIDASPIRSKDLLIVSQSLSDSSLDKIVNNYGKWDTWLLSMTPYFKNQYSSNNDQ